MNKVFVGWDSREDIAYQICKYSIEKRTKSPIEIIPLKQDELRAQGSYFRNVDHLGSTEFTFTRFFIPYLCGFSGKALFCDCDFLWRCDIQEIFDNFNDRCAVQVAQHDYQPKETIKMDGKLQHLYPRKNWSSLILWNCEHPSNMVLVPEFLNKATGSTLHQFKWLRNMELGSLDYQYNWLEGWYKEPKDGKPKGIHFTRGNVYFKDSQNVEYADLWKAEYKEMTGKDWSDEFILDKD